MLFLFCLFFISAVLALVTIYYPSYKSRKQCLDKIPSPKGLPLIGHALEIRSTVDIYEKMKKWFEEFGNLFRLNLGPYVLYVTSDTGLIKHVLTGNYANKKSKFYEFGRAWLGDGLVVVSNGEKWQKHRKAVQPTFHIKLLEQFIGTFDKHSTKLIKSLEKVENKKSVEISQYMSKCGLDIVCETIMGVNLNTQENKNSAYMEAIHFLMQNVMNRSFSVLGQINFTYSFTEAYKKEREQLKVVHGFVESVIKTRREELLKQQENKQELDFKKQQQRYALLDTLLLQSSFTDKDIRDEVHNFINAGYDTTSHALNFVLYCLSKYPSIQKTAYEEVYSIFEDNISRQFTYADLNELKYLENVIKETLRIYTIGQFVGREITEDFEYKGHKFLKGCEIYLYFQGAHLDPNSFKNPHKFDPERWNNGEENSFSYLPFSAGPRNCIGKKFAMFELKCVLSKILLNFEIVPSNPLKEPILTNEVVLKATNGMYIGLKKRTNPQLMC